MVVLRKHSKPVRPLLAHSVEDLKQISFACAFWEMLPYDRVRLRPCGLQLAILPMQELRHRVTGS